MNQAFVSAAADDVRPVAGTYFTGLWNHHESGVCEVYLADAPESVLERLHVMHPGVYVIHNDAPRSLQELEAIIKQFDVRALKNSGISIHQIGPTPHGYVRVAVERDASDVQAKLDEMFGSGVIRVVEAPRAIACAA